MRVSCCLRQRREKGADLHLCKDIELAIAPFHGCYFEYQEDWGLAHLGERMSVSILSDSVEIDGYGPQFSEEEIASLLELGWKETNALWSKSDAP